MGLYRIKIEPVEAEQWLPGKHVEGVQEIAFDAGDGRILSSGYGMCGAQRVDPGDWIVRNHPNPEIVPAAEFDRVYEPLRHY